MNTKKIKIVVLFLLGFGLLTAQAQQATTATGGNASGSGGTISYSVGQVFYTTNTGATAGSVAQGVQYAYEIFTLGIEDASIEVSLKAYPNPTTDYLTLSVDNFELSNLSYQLYDIRGRLLETKKINSNQTNIVMSNLASATYFLKVTQGNKEVKTLKIIKK